MSREITIARQSRKPLCTSVSRENNGYGKTYVGLGHSETWSKLRNVYGWVDVAGKFTGVRRGKIYDPINSNPSTLCKYDCGL